MKSKKFNNIRWKILLIFLFSIIASISVVLILLLLALVLIKDPAIKPIFKWLYLNIGAIPLMLITGLILFIIFFFVFTRKSILYLEEINVELKRIAKGNLETKIPIKRKEKCFCNNRQRKGLSRRSSINSLLSCKRLGI